MLALADEFFRLHHDGYQYVHLEFYRFNLFMKNP